jgi:hypothetical protein
MRVVEVSDALGEAMRQNRVRVSEVRIPTPQKDQVIQLTRRRCAMVRIRSTAPWSCCTM